MSLANIYFMLDKKKKHNLADFHNSRDPPLHQQDVMQQLIKLDVLLL